jgi:hypothetical protein
MTFRLTSPEKCLESAQDWAQNGWLRPLEKTLDCLLDIEGLGRCGFLTSFKTDFVGQLTPASPLVRYQDALAHSLGKLVDLILETRCGSLAQRSFYYPFKLAGLTSPDPEVVQGTLRQLEADVRSFWAAQDRMYECITCVQARNMHVARCMHLVM